MYYLIAQCSLEFEDVELELAFSLILTTLVLNIRTDSEHSQIRKLDDSEFRNPFSRSFIRVCDAKCITYHEAWFKSSIRDAFSHLFLRKRIEIYLTTGTENLKGLLAAASDAIMNLLYIVGTQHKVRFGLWFWSIRWRKTKATASEGPPPEVRAEVEVEGAFLELLIKLFQRAVSCIG